jgi:hypothetical protein
LSAGFAKKLENQKHSAETVALASDARFSSSYASFFSLQAQLFLASTPTISMSLHSLAVTMTESHTHDAEASALNQP